MIGIDTIWLVLAASDLRGCIDWLLAMVAHCFALGAQAHHAYVFANRRAHLLKVLVCDGAGMWLCIRRLQALLRLQAARSDAAYLLLHRVLVLETALLQLQARTAAAAGATGQAAVVPVPGAALRPSTSRSFLRDAAVVTAGIVAGQALWQGLSDAPAADGGDGLDIEGWL